jgi:aminopeptidase
VVGLLPGSRWQAARLTTVDGIVHAPNLPTEEVFTSPDPARTEGVVTSTKPLQLGGATISGLRVRFEAGRAVEITAAENGAALSSLADRDDGGRRLGEVALVDGESRIGQLGTVFYDTLLDENAASHLALGQAFEFSVEGEDDAERVNRSAIHVDFMIGSDAVQVTGRAADGREFPLLRGGAWQL